MSNGEFLFLDQCIQAMDTTFREWWVSRLPPPASSARGSREVGGGR